MSALVCFTQMQHVEVTAAACSDVWWWPWECHEDAGEQTQSLLLSGCLVYVGSCVGALSEKLAVAFS